MIQTRNVPVRLIPSAPADVEVGKLVGLLRESPTSAALIADGGGLFRGIFSIGDFTKVLQEFGTESLGRPVSEFLTATPIVARSKNEAQMRMSGMAGRVRYVPVLDYRGRCDSLLMERSRSLRLGGSFLDASSNPYVIAEIGLNHNGSIESAKQLVDRAARAGANAVKFQARGEDLYRPGDHYFSEDLSAQYVERLVDRFSLSFDQLKEVFDHARAAGGVDLICTAWDLESLAFLREQKIDAIKIASADFLNHELLKSAVDGLTPVLASTGMCTEIEIQKGLEILLNGACEVGLLHCISSYPPDKGDLNLGYIRHLENSSGCIVGYSSHELHGVGITPAIALGAKIIERHFTLDKTLEGTDHRISSDPDEFAALCTSIRDVSQMVNLRVPRTPTQGELLNREALAKSLVAARPLRSGHTLTEQDIAIRSPGRGMAPYLKESVLGRVLGRDIPLGDFIYDGDLAAERSSSGSRASDFHFSCAWGIPVRYHDYDVLSRRFRPDFLEVHLSAADLSFPINSVSFRQDIEHKFHTPDLFTGDHIIDLANRDDAYRAMSINWLNKTFDHIRSVLDRCGNSESAIVIASLGGFTEETPMSRTEMAEATVRLADSLTQLSLSRITLLAQTLPPLPWYLGGRRICNLFVDPEGTAQLAEELGLRICLDVAHTFLSCQHLGVPEETAWRVLLPHTDHLHVVDASGSSNEGLNIGDGEVNFYDLSRLIQQHAPSASFIPEIWQGHRNGGEGFETALNRLASLGFCPTAK